LQNDLEISDVTSVLDGCTLGVIMSLQLSIFEYLYIENDPTFPVNNNNKTKIVWH